MRIENLAKVNNTNEISVKGAKGEQGNGDFLATLLMVATQGEQSNSQQGKELLNGEQQLDLQQEQSGKQANTLDTNAALLQLLGTNSSDTMVTLPLTDDQMNQLIKTLETLAIGNKGQNPAALNEQQLKMLTDLVNGGAQANSKNTLELQQIIQQLQTGLASRELQQTIQQLQAGDTINTAEVQKILQQLAKQLNNQLQTNNVQNKQDQQVTDVLGQVNQTTEIPKTIEPSQAVLTQLANLAQQGQQQRGTLNNQPVVQQVSVQNTESTGSAAFTVQNNTLNVEAKLDSATLPEQLASRFGELLKEMAVRQQPNQTTMHLKLKPAHLGEVTVRLTYNRGELNAQFYATTGHGKEALEAALPQLRDALLQQQVKLNESSVFLANDDSRWLGRQNSQEHNPRGRAKTYRQVGDGDISIKNIDVKTETHRPSQQGLNLLV